MSTPRAAYRHVGRCPDAAAAGGAPAALDAALHGYWRALALPLAELAPALGVVLVTRRARLEPLPPAGAAAPLEIGLRCSRIAADGLVFEAGVYRGAALRAAGELVCGCADAASGAARPVPAGLLALLRDYEAGAAMVKIECGGWDALQAGARAIRSEVFIGEQRVPPALEWDAADAAAVHALARNRLGLPLATGRLLASDGGVGRIGRMAVRRALRGSGVGRAVLQALLDAAVRRGDRRIELHAQTTAAGFYRRMGFSAHGAAFEEAGIAHVCMSRGFESGQEDRPDSPPELP